MRTSSGLSVAEPGRNAPLGATVFREGVNFSVFSRHATEIELLLFDEVDQKRPSRVIRLDHKRHRTYHYWHVLVPGLQAGQMYAYRANGPYDPPQGLRFDPEKVLLDPYGVAVVVPPGYDREAAKLPGSNTATAMKSVVADRRGYDWEGDVPLCRPYSHTVIYEMHVGGFTRNPNSGVEAHKRGTFAGLIDKIPYLKFMGVTAVELMPVFAFDPQDCPKGLVNYWGYAPVSFFAPHPAYSSRKDPLGPIDEFRDMVKALHRAGIEVILDVVYNHTAEGDENGPTLSLKGLDNSQYYILEKGDRSRYSNYSGTGNCLNANHAAVRRMILDSLRYWVQVMHVDGFRFDLASILARDEDGRTLENPPLLWDIESDPVLAGSKLIAEAWDAAGLYQVGSFVGDSWKEWNGKFRDDVRSFLKGENGTVERVAQRLLGSPDIFGHGGREVEQSINFVTCHDGFTLNDLVSYERKHNEANLENSRDGMNDNYSWNCGVEGPSDNPQIERMRNRQIKNFLAITMLSLGTPMILMGDEVRRTQRGNNNAYCQDSELNWFDWSLLEKHVEIQRFARHLIEARVSRRQNSEDLTLTQLLKEMELTWHGVKARKPDWSETSHSLAFALKLPGDPYTYYIILNAYWEPLQFELPAVPLVNSHDHHSKAPKKGAGVTWHRWIDTALAPPEDITSWGTPAPLSSPSYLVQERSCVVLLKLG